MATKVKETLIVDRMKPRERMDKIIELLEKEPPFHDKYTAGERLRDILTSVEAIGLYVNSRPGHEVPYQMTVTRIQHWKEHRIYPGISFSLHPNHLVLISKTGAIQIVLLKDLPKDQKYNSNTIGESDREALDLITKKVLLDKKNRGGQSVWPLF